jgi:hypothetical protein
VLFGFAMPGCVVGLAAVWAIAVSRRDIRATGTQGYAPRGDGRTCRAQRAIVAS